MFLRERLTLGIQNNAHVKICCKSLRKRAKKVVFDSPGLVDFAIELYGILFLILARWASEVFEEFNLQKNCEINSAHPKKFGG